MWLLHNEQDSKLITTNDVFGRASNYLDIGTTKLRQFWDKWLLVRGNALPPSHIGVKRKEQMIVLSSKCSGTIRKIIFDLRIMSKNGHPVEMPDVLKVLRDEHNIFVSKSQLRYRMHKMGFPFGKVKKYCLRKEGDRITAKRRLYLKARLKYNTIININKEKRNEWMSSNSIGPIEREIVYIYIDESYVNRNHCIGHTWYHEDDEVPGMCNLPSGKGERFVMLTGVTQEYGMLEGDNDVLDSLMLFQARKATGDYHQNMDSDMFCMWLEKQLFPILDKKGIKAI